MESNKNKKLQLNKETITELDNMNNVVGGGTVTIGTIGSEPNVGIGNGDGYEFLTMLMCLSKFSCFTIVNCESMNPDNPRCIMF